MTDKLTPRMTLELLRGVDAEIFWSHVDRQGTGCWEWQGALDRGYGAFHVTGTKSLRAKAHRVAFFLATGTWPPVVRHFVCNNPPCCRPKHLRAGSQKDNVADAIRRGTFGWMSAPAPRGTQHHSARLDEQGVREIRDRYRRGDGTHRSLAAEYGMSRAAIAKVVTGRTWTHV